MFDGHQDKIRQPWFIHMQVHFDTKKHGIVRVRFVYACVCACVRAPMREDFIILFVSVLKNEE